MGEQTIDESLDELAKEARALVEENRVLRNTIAALEAQRDEERSAKKQGP